MLAGVLGVLKVIGIVLLVILAVLLVLILLVLFVPVRYKADLYIPETEFDKGFDVGKIDFSARFTWLLHIVSGGIDFPEDKQFFVKVFGIKVFPKKDKKKEEKADNNSETMESDKTDESTDDGVIEMSDMQELESSNDDTDGTGDGTDNDAAVSAEDANNTQQEETGSQDNDEPEPADSDTGTDSQPDENSNEYSDEFSDEDEGKDRALIEIIQDIFDKIENILKTPQNVFKKIQYTISRVCGKIKMIKTTLESDIFKRAYKLVKGKLVRLLKMILPDKYKAEILLGLGDPATTAELMGAYGVLYPIMLDRVVLEPDFERKVVKVRAHVKGHITLFVVLYCVLVCYFNRDVKKVIRRFKKIFNT